MSFLSYERLTSWSVRCGMFLAARISRDKLILAAIVNRFRWINQMSSLVVDAVRCVEETDEVGSDDVYMIIFRGDPKPPFSSNLGVHGPGNFWSNLDSGDLRESKLLRFFDPDAIPIAQYFSDAVYVIMLVEEDASKDISGSEVIGAWKTVCGAAWKGALLGLRLSGNWPPSAAQLSTAASNVGHAMLGLASIYMEFPKGDDDVIGKPQQIVISPGKTPTHHFKGDGGYYRVRFNII